MERRFEKWHGLGNDFVVVDDVDGAWWAQRAVAVCDRHTGIGADGVLIVGRASETPSMAVINADGSRPEMCGNGLRCVVGALGEWSERTAYDTAIATGAGVLAVEGRRTAPGAWSVRSELGRPQFGAAAVGAAGDALRWGADDLGEGALVSMGNPHWVFLDAPGLAVLRARGAALEHDPRFPARTNVEFVTQVGPRAFTVDVWERGCGLTRACGTGAAAVAAELVRAGRVAAGDAVSLRLPGGVLTARQLASGAIEIEGPAARVFEGRVPSTAFAPG